MNVHFSVDDVIQPFRTVTYERPENLFDLPFFDTLKKLNAEYNIAVTLYCYCIYEADGFCLNKVPSEYWHELISAGFIKLGFHGCFNETDSGTFIEHAGLFYDSVPAVLASSTLRLHRYSAEPEAIDFLAKIGGVKQLLCRDNKTKTLNDAPASYNLSEDQWHELVNKKSLDINGISYRQTDILLESYTSEDIAPHLKKAVNDSCDDKIVVFTHNKILDNDPGLVYDMCDALSEFKVKYIF